MKKDLISVVVPTYKRKPELIKRAIDSILRQTYDNLELLVIDDSPSDFEHRKEVESFLESLSDNRIRYIKHERNYGANKARNTGIELANGKYVAFLDDDDVWMEDKLELQIEKFDNPNIGLVYCKATVIDEVQSLERPILNKLRKGNYYEELLKQNFIGSNSFVLIRSDVIREVGMYDEDLLSNQDYDLFLRISKSYEINYVDKVLVKYYIHEGDRISTDSRKQLQGRIELEKKFKEFIDEDKELKLIWKIKRIPLYYNAGQKVKALNVFFHLFFTHPLFLLNYLKSTLAYIAKKVSRHE